MVRHKDQFWEYVENINGRLVCKFCQCDFAGGISRIKSHLSGVRRRDIAICCKVPEDVQSAAFEAVNSSKKKGKSKEGPKNIERSGSISCSSSSPEKSPCQSSMPKICKKKDKKLLDQKLAKLIMSSKITLDVIETTAFVDFIKGVAGFGPSYEIPSCSSLQTELVCDLEKEVMDYTANAKKLLATSGCTIMMHYTSKSFEDVLCIFACTPGGVVYMNSYSDGGSTDRLYSYETLVSVIKSIGPEHVVQWIVQNKKDYEYLSMYPWVYTTLCVSSDIKSLLGSIYTEVDWVNNILGFARLIVKYITTHNVNLSMRKYYLVSQDYNFTWTDFASNILMLQSILEVENEFQLLQLPVPSSLCHWCGTRSGQQLERHIEAVKFMDCIIHSTEFWRQGKEILQFFKPLIQVLHLVDDFWSTSGYLYEAWERAKHATKECFDKNEVVYRKIWDLFNEHQSSVIHPVHAAAAFLNPAYMCSEKFRFDRSIQEGVEYTLKRLVSIDEKEVFTRELMLYSIKVPNLFTDTAMIMLKTFHPRIWWEQCGEYLPVLRKYALRILSQPCSSSLCKQYKLESQMSRDFQLKIKIMLMENYSAMEAQEKGPIDLDNLSGLPNYADYQEFEDETSVHIDWDTELSFFSSAKYSQWL